MRESGNPAGAEEAYLRALELEPDNPDTVLHVGRVKLALNDAASAASYLERAAALSSPSLDAARELQTLRARLAADALSAADKARDEKRWAAAIDAYEAFLLLKPEAALIWVQLGHCLTESGKATEAERAYLKALELDPDSPNTLLHLGRARQSMDDPATAARYFQRAATAPSPSVDAREELRALLLSHSAKAGDTGEEEKRWLDEFRDHASSLGVEGFAPDPGNAGAADIWIQFGRWSKKSAMKGAMMPDGDRDDPIALADLAKKLKILSELTTIEKPSSAWARIHSTFTRTGGSCGWSAVRASFGCWV